MSVTILKISCFCEFTLNERRIGTINMLYFNGATKNEVYFNCKIR